MKRRLLFLIILLASSAAGQDRPKLIGEIEFFGYAGTDTNKLRAALPFHQQDRFIVETFVAQLELTGAAVKQVTGPWPTDLANVCCDDRGNRVIFIGLAGHPTYYNAPPKGHTRLPDKLLSLYDQSLKLNDESVQQGIIDEADSQGYALSVYPPLRSIQLEMRAYAVGHEADIHEVLETAADERQRIAAATLLGYARQSPSQLAALVRASHDSSGGVHNNATRALIVLARSSPKVASKIPAASFIELLLSGAWTDLNKASNLLYFITKSRNKEILTQLRRREVLDRWIEIARWRSHGELARYILGASPALMKAAWSNSSQLNKWRQSLLHSGSNDLRERLRMDSHKRRALHILGTRRAYSYSWSLSSPQQPPRWRIHQPPLSGRAL